MILRQMWGSLFDCGGQSVWTVLAALSELANTRIQAHLVMQRALTQQVLCVKYVWVPVVVRGVKVCVLAAAECMARLVFVARDMSAGSVFLQAGLRQSNKAGMASQMHRSAWPGRCASAGEGSGR